MKVRKGIEDVGWESKNVRGKYKTALTCPPLSATTDVVPTPGFGVLYTAVAASLATLL